MEKIVGWGQGFRTGLACEARTEPHHEQGERGVSRERGTDFERVPLGGRAV